jgi:hypothetical protein
MSSSHGDLFSEIGKLVLAANSGEAIDLGATAKDLAERYQSLGISEEMIARTVSRSIGAVGLAMARVANGDSRRAAREAIHVRAGELIAANGGTTPSGRSLFPSGVRVAVLS